jgi:hypothetical protein
VNNQARVTRHPGYQPIDITSPLDARSRGQRKPVELSGAKNSAHRARVLLRKSNGLQQTNRQCALRPRPRSQASQMPGRLIEPLVAADYLLVTGQSPRARNMTAFATHPFWRRSRSRSSKIAKFASNAFNVSLAPDVEAPAALSRAISSRCRATIRRSSATCRTTSSRSE